MLTKLAAVILLCASTYAAPIPEGGRDMLPTDWQGAAQAMGSSKLWKAEKADFAEHGQGWRLDVVDNTAGPFQLQLSTAVSGEIKTGDRVLVAFDARFVPGSSTDGKGRVQVFVEIKEPPNYEKLGQDAADLTSEWQTIFVPFPARIDSKTGVTFASILPGGKKQTLEIANMRLINYGADFDMAKLPRPYIAYPGREADAPWRKLALERIAKYRTTDIAIEVVSEDGKPVPDAKISVTLKRHAFAFGTAVKAKLLVGEDAAAQKYRDMIDENFSAIVLENDLKPFAWNGGVATQSKSYQPEWTLNALAWAKSHDLKARGHYLCWGPWEPWSEKLKDDPKAIRDRVMNHLDSVMKG
ncbi:MAG: endo-1,4-beta-xylanase, partial [Verrucomicrobiales bacterium]|nr:endo-1,4-beta-xylanase [Verrucomicrobiales bacterium]